MPLPRLAPLLALAACTSTGAPPSDAASVADALRSLRAVAVGDRRFGSSRARDVATSSVGRTVRTARTEHRAPTIEPAPDTTGWPTAVIRFTSRVAEPRTLWVGDTVAFVAPEPPIGTPPAIAADLRWTSLEPSAAIVSPSGEVVARAPGTAPIVAWRPVGETVTPVTVLPAVRGRVAGADGGPVRTRIVVRVGAWTDTIVTDAGGSFVLRPTRPLDGVATVLAEPLDGAHASARLADAPLSRLADLDIVLLPTRWRIATGTYAGQVVPIRPAIAQGRARDGLRFVHVSAPGRAVGWSAARLPLAVALDAGPRGAAVGTGDSVAFWTIARRLERDWGAPLFRPAPRVTTESLDFTGIVVTVDPRISSAGLTTTGWNGDGEVSDATVAVRARSLLGDPGVVTHELLHALGIGHAGDWTSVMHPSADAATGGRASVEDVAYGQLLYAVRARSRGSGTPVGIAEAAAAADPDR